MRIGALLLLAGLAVPVHAADNRTWPIDSAASKARFSVHLRLPVKTQGQFRTVEGELQALPNLQYAVRVQLDARQLQMSGPDWIQRVTQSPAFLNTAAHPLIRFQSAPFSQQVLISGGSIEGVLSLRGQSRTVAFSVSPTACQWPGVSCPIKAVGQVNRRDFGMDAYRFSVKDEVEFQFQLTWRHE